MAGLVLAAARVERRLQRALVRVGEHGAERIHRTKVRLYHGAAAREKDSVRIRDRVSIQKLLYYKPIPTSGVSPVVAGRTMGEERRTFFDARLVVDI